LVERDGLLSHSHIIDKKAEASDLPEVRQVRMEELLYLELLFSAPSLLLF
jgi:hypothetical protein